MRSAILVDGAFFLKRIHSIYGSLTPSDTVTVLMNGCHSLLSKKYNHTPKNLYRILFYDCPPLNKKFHNPISKKSVDLSKSDLFIFRTQFHRELLNQANLALRRGNIDELHPPWTINPVKLKEIFSKKTTFEDLTENDVSLSFRQKGVDMKIGLDIASLTYKKLVEQIILISGDSDFVPAAKLARREGIQFLLDPMQANIKPDLFEHIDGLFDKIWTRALLPKKKKR
ncbi:MAG: NYN domain-containing protein [Leptospirillum sp.]